VGDSIARNVPDLRGFENQAKGGETTRSLQMRIANGHIKVGGFRVIVIHVGTNDIANGKTAEDIVFYYDNLIQAIRRQNQTATLVVSAIIPRWLDDGHTKPVIAKANQLLQRNADRKWACLFLRSDKLFRFSGMVRKEFYQQDTLHLNVLGSKRLRDFVATQTSREQLRLKEECRKRCVRGDR